MKRIVAGWILVALGLLAGCGQGADPLDWKIDASGPAALQTWCNEKIPLMPEALGREFSTAIGNVQVTLPPARTTEPLEKANYLCARLKDKTVRDVIIEGHEIAYKMLLARAKNQSDEILRLMNASDRMSEHQRDQLLAAGRAGQEDIRRQIAYSEKRLAELRASPGSR